MAAFGDGHEHPTETTGECVVCLRDELQQAQERLQSWEEGSHPAVMDLQAERDADIKRAEAAEALAEARLTAGLWFWKIIAVAIGKGARLNITVRDKTPAEAQEDGD